MRGINRCTYSDTIQSSIHIISDDTDIDKFVAEMNASIVKSGVFEIRLAQGNLIIAENKTHYLISDNNSYKLREKKVANNNVKIVASA